MKICNNCQQVKQDKEFSTWSGVVKGKRYTYKRKKCTPCLNKINRDRQRESYKSKAKPPDKLNGEKWKQITDYEKYFVSSKGRVKRENKQLVKPEKLKKGYCRVILSKNGKVKKFSVHRLVAIAFIPNPENKPEVNHINGKKQDNKIKNLEWVTRIENHLHYLKNKK